ncbi:hypothetical protein M0R19_03690 [Candidatus Pacearchaeota archaeon]|jgi:hypothetical protein|nr:hypothetical protein [Candidatus Pacearchaeota archaeon]
MEIFTGIVLGIISFGLGVLLASQKQKTKQVFLCLKCVDMFNALMQSLVSSEVKESLNSEKEKEI